MHPQSSDFGPWCNGNTTVFGAVFQGSSPCGPTDKPTLTSGFFVLQYKKNPILLIKRDSIKICGRLYFES